MRGGARRGVAANTAARELRVVPAVGWGVHHQHTHANIIIRTRVLTTSLFLL